MGDPVEPIVCNFWFGRFAAYRQTVRIRQAILAKQKMVSDPNCFASGLLTIKIRVVRNGSRQTFAESSVVSKLWRVPLP